jgi:hypothetical protein
VACWFPLTTSVGRNLFVSDNGATRRIAPQARLPGWQILWNDDLSDNPFGMTTLTLGKARNLMIRHGIYRALPHREGGGGYPGTPPPVTPAAQQFAPAKISQSRRSAKRVFVKRKITAKIIPVDTPNISAPSAASSGPSSFHAGDMITSP